MTAPLMRCRTDLEFSPLKVDGAVKYLVEDPLNNRFFRIGALEYELCSVLDGSLPLPVAMSVLKSKSNLGRDASPEKLQKIVSWILQSGLVEECSPSATTPNANKNAPPKKAIKPFDPSFFRIKALTPELITRIARPLTWLVSWPAMFVAAGLWAIAIGLVIQNGSELTHLGKQLFVPGSQWWLLSAWVLLKAVHESGHAIACIRVGAKPNGAGIGFMFFAPTPYVDVTGLWRIENRWSRILVSGAGMLFEMTFAALAVIVACSSENPHVKFLAVTIASLGTLTTIAFNANPLMRYDGYYMFIDAVNRPNLWQDANKCMRAYFGSWFMKTPTAVSWTFPLLLYGIASWMSRITMLIGMGWGVLLAWDGIGLLIVGFFFSLWFILPHVIKLQSRKTSARSSLAELHASICPAKATKFALLAAVLSAILFLPSPVRVYWPAILDYVNPTELRASAPGFVHEVLVNDGESVERDQAIIRLANPQLELEFSASEMALKTSNEKCSLLRSQRKLFELQAEELVRESLEVKAATLRSKVASLTIMAPRRGVLLARSSQNLIGSFLTEGQPIGLIVDPDAVEVKASIPQDAWEELSHLVGSPVDIYPLNTCRLSGSILETLPRTSDVLESPALAGIYGGPIPVVMSKTEDGKDELKTDGPRLTTRIELDPPTIDPLAPSGRRPDVLDHLPPPGSICSVCIRSEREAIWQTAYRWGKSLAKRQLPADGSQ